MSGFLKGYTVADPTGNGVVYANHAYPNKGDTVPKWVAKMKAAAEKNEIAVVTSGPVRGHFPDDHRLSCSLAPDAMMSADLVVFVGQYCMPSPGEYAFKAGVPAIRVHPVHEDLGRNWPLDHRVAWSFVTWLIYLFLIFFRWTAGWRGRKAAYLAIAGFATVIISWGVSSNMHAFMKR